MSLSRYLFVLVLSVWCLSVACRGSGGSDAIFSLDQTALFSRNRDVSTAVITPVLSESGSGFDSAEVDSPCVVKDGSRPGGDKYVLYYEATDGSGVSTIGAVSSDEEDFATLTLARSNIVTLGGGGSFYDVGATDPTVIVNHGIAYGVSGRYRMWFEGRSGAGGVVSTIITATSADGTTWGSFSVCTGLTASFASVRIADPTVLLVGGTYKMWFDAVNSTGGPSSIGYAESSDGTAWTVRDASGSTGASAVAVFTQGPDGAFDAYGVGSPGVVQAASGTYIMFYEAADSSANTLNTIGIARSSDGLTWSDPTLPIVVPSSDSISPLPFDSGDVEHPAVLINTNFTSAQAGYFLLWYTGDGENGVSPNRIGLVRGYEL